MNTIKVFKYRLIEYFKKYSENWDKMSQNEEAAAIEFAKKYVTPNPENDKNLQRAMSRSHKFNEIFLGYNENRDYKPYIPKAKEIIKSNKTEKDMVLYRGIDESTFENMKKEGTKIDIDLYSKDFFGACTLLKKHDYNKKIHLRIFVPEGSCAYYNGDFNSEHLCEIILYDFKLKIKSKDSKYYNCILIE